MNSLNTVIIILGPTASGKTAVSLEVAKYFNTCIISADSRQCYNELNIGVAKPSKKELNSVKHYFINSHSVTENVTAFTFEEYALKASEEIFHDNNVAIMVGGTGLYIKAFCQGLDVIPSTDKTIRENIINQYNQKGLTWLQTEVKEKDFEYWQQAEQQNPQRLMRALEVLSASGKSITVFRRNQRRPRDFRILKVGLDVSREVLNSNISIRADKMIEDGLIEEVRSLIPYRDFNALQTVGYKEIFDYFNGIFSLEEAIKQIKKNTRQYAKRQLTWFKKDAEIHWLTSPFSIKDFLSIYYKK